MAEQERRQAVAGQRLAVDSVPPTVAAGLGTVAGSEAVETEMAPAVELVAAAVALVEPVAVPAASQAVPVASSSSSSQCSPPAAATVASKSSRHCTHQRTLPIDTRILRVA